MDWQALLNTLLQFATSFGFKLLGAIIVFSVGLKLISWITKAIRKSVRVQKLDDSLESFLTSFIKIALYLILFVTVAMILGVPTTSFITILASCGVAVGLALQGSLSNFAGGLMILFFKPFKVGDTIETATGKTGVVKKIMIFTTELHTFDNQVVFLPNGALANGEITNLSHGKVRRTDLKLSVAYGDKIADARKVILDILKKDSRVMWDPAPQILIERLGDSGVELVVRYWAKYADAYASSLDLIEQIYEILPKKKINFPFPQLDVRITK